MKIKEPGIIPGSEAFFATPGTRTRKLFYYVTCTGHFRYENTYSLKRDHYNSFLMMYVLNGSGRLQLERKESIFQKDDLVLVDCYEPHGYHAQKDLETLWLHFDGLNSREIYREICPSGPGMAAVKDRRLVRELMQEIYQMHVRAKRVDEGIQSACLSRIFAELLGSEPEQEEKEEPELAACLAYIQRNLAEDIRVKDLAECVSLSEFYFSRWFRSRMGASPYEYITSLRVNEAKIRLKTGRSSLASIASECGFASEGNFIRSFKRMTGTTPGEFRKMGL